MKKGVRPNMRIRQTQITPLIRVSTAGIFYEEYWGNRFQYETWCFSNDPKQRSFQVIHGSYCGISPVFIKRSLKIHKYISDGLLRRHVHDEKKG